MIKVNYEVTTKYKPTPPTPVHYSKGDAAALWGLQIINLKELIADYYLLQDLYVGEAPEFEPIDEGHFEPHVAWMFEQFSAYTDMVVGGELRHGRKMIKAWSKLPKPMASAIKEGSLLAISRNAAWHAWYYFRLQYGTLALGWAEDAFARFKSNAYGGPKWAAIARALRWYEEDVHTQVGFVDECCSLQHNGGSYFNKLWSVHGLDVILNAGFANPPMYATLLKHATTGVQEFYASKKDIVLDSSLTQDTKPSSPISDEVKTLTEPTVIEKASAGTPLTVSDIKLKHLWAAIKYWGGQSNVWSEQGIHKSFDALVNTDGLLHNCRHCSLSVKHHEFYQWFGETSTWAAIDVLLEGFLVPNGYTSKWLASGDLGYKCTGALAKKGWLQND
jgi:hypothetical protein